MEPHTGEPHTAKPDTALAAARTAMRLADANPGRAQPAARLAVRRARREGDPVAAAVAELALGHSLSQCGEVPAAIRHLRAAARHGDEAGSTTLAGEARMKLAYALVQRGQPRAALHAIDAALSSLTGPGKAIARAQRAVILYEVGRLEEALAEFRIAIPALRRTQQRRDLQRALVNRGLTLSGLAYYQAAIADLKEADTIARELNRPLAIGIIAENLGFVESLRGDVPAALRYLDDAERTIVEHGGQLAPVLLDRSQLLLSVGLVAETREVAERAIAAFQASRRQLKVPEMRLTLARASYLDGKTAEAATQARLAAKEFAAQHRDGWAALARLTAVQAGLANGEQITDAHVQSIVDVLVAGGRKAAALEARLVAARLAERRGRADVSRGHLEPASAERRRGPAARRARGWYAEALLRQADGRTREAATAVRAGLRILDEHSTALGATDLRVYSAVHRAELTDLGLRIAMRDGRARQVFEWSERGRASRLVHRAVLPPPDPELAELLGELRATALEIDKARLAGQPVARLEQRQVALERRIRDRNRLLPGGSGQQGAGPVSPSVLGAALGDRALLEFVQFDGKLHALTLVDGVLRRHELAAVAEVTDLLDRIPFALHKLARRDGRSATIEAAAALLDATAVRLDRLLLAGLAEIGDRPLVVVPTGGLHSLPWSILPSCAHRPVVVSPSATLWHAAATATGSAAQGVAVAAGPGLSGARAEAQAVAAIHDGAQAMLDDTATVGAVLAALTTVDVMHLAAHGRLATNNPLFSDLRLHDGPLVVYDLERLPRVPSTVVLAACDSGRSVVRTGDELLGLAATFIARGTMRLIASVVPIPDAETAPLMVALHQRLAKGHSPAAALAEAQREVRDESPAGRAAAAGFVCIGA
ncbi:CHAT domain-containing protein [Labedaea rhizosphaerae]|uniref:CHAT domain-containing protein n=1 Tax=Labedaea rhizosphaerae TaxID=598644 RepID=A0A4R6SIB3_LABRH|nr:CHAT domain-containing tetratricopeptide repeat protein [Labedaea rhizosphaerae]TDQ01330.1 CHAT domain-containing protein [Labedaea rhizosphaerae]